MLAKKLSGCSFQFIMDKEIGKDFGQGVEKEKEALIGILFMKI